MFLNFLLLSVILGVLCRYAVQSWPKGGHPVVSIIILVMAVWSAWKGTAAAARVGCVLFWIVLLLYLVLLGAGVKDIQIRWLIPTKGDVNSIGGILLLTPAVAALHLNRSEVIKPRLLLIAVFCITASAITAGVLSPAVAKGTENAFYEMTRSLNLLGQARRFEAVLSAGMTLGWFSLINLYLTLCNNLAENIHAGSGRWGCIASAILALIIQLCDLHIPGILLLILGAVFWVFLPLLAQGLGMIKKSQKSENSA